ncbi:MAG: alpha/beta fold hydrolase [Terriglobales bacterium]
MRIHRSYATAMFLLAAILSFSSAAKSQTTAAPATASAAEWSDLLSTNYGVAPNITYRQANTTDLKLDLYEPRAAAKGKPVPVVMFIHGGGWVAGTKEGSELDLMPYLQMGFAAVNVEYRMASNSLAPAAVEDCRCALHWIVNNAAKYNFDLNRVVVTGGSAGGHLALTTGLLTPEAGFDRGCTPPVNLRWDKADTTVPKVAAIVNWFGITDVADLFAGPNAKGYAIEWFGSLPNREELAHRVSPLYMVNKDSPPVITIHGDKDTLVPYTQAQRLHEALTRAGVRNELVTIPNGGHGGFPPDQQERAMEAVRKFLKANGVVE